MMMTVEKVCELVNSGVTSHVEISISGNNA